MQPNTVAWVETMQVLDYWEWERADINLIIPLPREPLIREASRPSYKYRTTFFSRENDKKILKLISLIPSGADRVTCITKCEKFY